jgi:hypothetical protein
MVIGSIVPVLAAYGIFIWCAHRWHAGVAAFACALAAVLCTRLTFYDPVLEANWLLAFPFLFMGWAMRKDASAEWKAKDIAIALVLLVIPMNAHPAGWLLMLAIVAMLWSRGALQKREAIISAAVVLGWTLLMAIIVTPTTYERTQYELVFKGLGKLNDLSSWASTQFLVDHTFRLTFTYLPALLVALAVITGWLLRSSVRDALVLAMSAGAFKVIYLLALHAGDSGVMMDRGILPMAVIIAASAALLIRVVELLRETARRVLRFEALRGAAARSGSADRSRRRTRRFQSDRPAGPARCARGEGHLGSSLRDPIAKCLARTGA